MIKAKWQSPKHHGTKMNELQTNWDKHDRARKEQQPKHQRQNECPPPPPRWGPGARQGGSQESTWPVLFGQVVEWIFFTIIDLDYAIVHGIREHTPKYQMQLLSVWDNIVNYPIMLIFWILWKSALLYSVQCFLNYVYNMFHFPHRGFLYFFRFTYVNTFCPPPPI